MVAFLFTFPFTFVYTISKRKSQTLVRIFDNVLIWLLGFNHSGINDVCKGWLLEREAGHFVQLLCMHYANNFRFSDSNLKSSTLYLLTLMSHRTIRDALFNLWMHVNETNRGDVKVWVYCNYVNMKVYTFLLHNNFF